MSNTTGGEGFSAFGMLVFAAACGLVVWAGGWREALYVVEYGLKPDKIQVAAKPKDCDFLTAPLGLKGCEYKAVVHVYNAAGRQIERDEKGKPLVSFNDGRTWVDASPTENLTTDHIAVSWIKQTD